MCKHILVFLVPSHNKSHSSREKVTQWRTMCHIPEINTDINSKFQIHTEFYTFMGVRTPIKVFWVVTPCISTPIFVRWRLQVNPKRLSQPASLYNVITHSILRESPN